MNSRPKAVSATWIIVMLLVDAVFSYVITLGLAFAPYFSGNGPALGVAFLISFVIGIVPAVWAANAAYKAWKD